MKKREHLLIIDFERSDGDGGEGMGVKSDEISFYYTNLC